MDQLIRYLQQKGRSKSSIKSYVRCCEKFTAWAEYKHIAIENTTYTDLLDYITELRKRNLAQHSIIGYMTAVSHYFDHLIKLNIITVNPAKYLQLKNNQARKLYPVLSREQLEHLYTHLETKATRNTRPTAKASAIRNRITVGLLVFQGLNSTALGALTVRDVDVLGGNITIQSSRTHAARNLPLQAIQIIELDRYINQTRKELQHAFKKEESEALLITGFAQFNESL
ncbi:hypothetical protein FNH22_25025 [Fulvivirga sp. M361]|uniref:tyrosine-type recombinase/integrase n=1 Tax=Fulvivirga sp. M361 TaxID=2594266 RepID=UPI001179CCFC|nr:site-specific integrase [Fulvivirga sp. M361]TRX50918.1 hypothetical protein FNH22_25025 [Fulvivirga sp. M361]